MIQSRIIITAVFLITIISSAHSLNVSAGVNAWYVWWSPSIEDKFRGEDNDITARVPGASTAYNDTFQVDPHIMAGPMLNLQLSERWSLGFVMLVSQHYTLHSSYDVSVPGPDTDTSRIKCGYRRYDGDFTANYRIGYGFGIFCGIKYMRWEGTGTQDITTVSGTYLAHVGFDFLGQALGPAAGLSYSLPLTESLFFTASASGLIMKSDFEQENVVSDTLSPTRKETLEDDDTFYAFNGMAGIGYYIGSLKSTVVLGGRFQYLDTRDKPRDLFYGFTATVMYHF